MRNRRIITGKHDTSASLKSIVRKRNNKRAGR
jgi:hypothetical protein